MSDWNSLFLADDFDAAPPEWLLAESEDRIRAADELPFLRPSLRREFVAELGMIDRQRERNRRVVLAAVVAMAIVPLWWLSQLWPERAIAQHLPFEVREHLMVPKDAEESLKALPESLVGAVRNPDGFRLVDAFSELRQQHSASLGFGGDRGRSE